VRLFGEQLYGEDYRDRNRDYYAEKRRSRGPNQTAAIPATVDTATNQHKTDEPWLVEELSDEDRDAPF
jgi:hypothetical protein